MNSPDGLRSDWMCRQAVRSNRLCGVRQGAQSDRLYYQTGCSIRQAVRSERERERGGDEEEEEEEREREREREEREREREDGAELV